MVSLRNATDFSLAKSESKTMWTTIPFRLKIGEKRNMSMESLDNAYPEYKPS